METDAVTGHTSYVSAVVEAPERIDRQQSPMTYGLATLRVDYVFGLFSQYQPITDTGDRMVFTWASGTPDPRDDPTLRPTGDFAHVYDRLGVRWTVYELVYQGIEDESGPSPGPYHAYAVALGPVRHLEDGSAYNHVLTYQIDRLIAPLQPAESPAGPHEAGADPLEPVEVPQREAGPDTWVAQGMLESHPGPEVYRLETAVGLRPSGLPEMGAAHR